MTRAAASELFAALPQASFHPAPSTKPPLQPFSFLYSVPVTLDITGKSGLMGQVAEMVMSPSPGGHSGHRGAGGRHAEYTEMKKDEQRDFSF